MVDGSKSGTHATTGPGMDVRKSTGRKLRTEGDWCNEDDDDDVDGVIPTGNCGSWCGGSSDDDGGRELDVEEVTVLDIGSTGDGLA